MLKVNLKKAARIIAPADDYIANITKAELRDSKASKERGDNPVAQNLHLEFKIDGDIHPAAADAMKIYLELPQVENSAYRTVELLQALKNEPLEGDENADVELDEKELEGAQVGIRVGVDEDYDPAHPKNVVTAFFNAAEALAEGEKAEEPAKEEEKAPAKGRKAAAAK